MFYLIAFGLITLTLLILSVVKKPYNYPPGPRWYPFIGSYLTVKKLSRALGGQHIAFSKLSKIYNSNIIGLKLGSEKVVVISSFEMIKEIIYKHEYNGRPNNFFLRLRSMGTRKGISGADGDLWKIQRNFAVTHLRSLGFGLKPMEEMVHQEVSDVLSIIKTNEGKEVKIVPIISVSVLNVLWRLLSGSRLQRHDNKLKKLLLLLDKRALAFNMAGGFLNHFPWIRFILPEKSGYNLIQELNTELKTFLMHTINEHYSSWEDDKRDDLIYSFITEMNKNKGKETTFTEDQLMMVCLDIFIAGSQTTSNSLDFAFLMMLLYPDVQEKLRNYINDRFNKTEDITYNSRSRIPYVEAVLCEVQRYCHVIPISGPKRVIKDTQLGGYRIPKDTTILMSFYSIHQDKTYWNDPDTFRPERFLDADGNLFIPDRFMPYGVGLRRCMGEILARTSVFTFFAEIIRHYKIVVPEGTQKPSTLFDSGITLLPKNYKAKFISVF